jgi:anthranilate phosphoribosyltransferase
MREESIKFLQFLENHPEKPMLAHDFVECIAHPASTSVEIAALTAAWKAKGQSVEDLLAVVNYLQATYLPVIEVEGLVFDCCGTGGDGRGTFNISTALAFILATAGVRVAKHGGRRTTSASGSIDFLEALEVPTYSERETIQHTLGEKGLVFIASPILGKLLKRWKEVCRHLGLMGQTGLIGTLTNPVRVSRQLVGVHERSRCEMLGKALSRLGREKAAAVCSEPGLDELSTCGTNYVYLWEDGGSRELVIAPRDFGLRISSVADLQGGTPLDNAATFRDLLNNQGPTGLLETMYLNAGFSLWLCGLASSIEEGIAKASELLRTGAVEDFFSRYTKTHAPN